MTRVVQPPMNRDTRATERHEFWPGFSAVLAGAILLYSGSRHWTGVNTADGGSAHESQLVMSFAYGGLQYPDQVASPPPPRMEDPVAQAEALDRWAKEQEQAQPPRWKVRVVTGARTPCPT